MLKRILCLLVSLAALATALNLSVITPVATNTQYTGPYVQVGDVTLPLADHMPGTFFTKNGKACTCHYTADCISSPSNCNCMRYYPTGNAATCEIDLMAVQCFGFSRLIFYKCFGFIDQAQNADKYHSVGSLSASQMSAENAKNLLMKAKAGAHVRLTRGHSVSILTMDEDFLVIYHGNSGGDGVASASCVVSTKRYTWAEFASYASAGILYVNMPNDYPGSTQVDAPKEVGYYEITSDTGLRLRAEPNTSAETYEIIPYKTLVQVTQINGNWGKAAYNGKTGWIFLEYADYKSSLTIKPTDSAFGIDDNGYIRGVEWKLTKDDLLAHFQGQNLVITDSLGGQLSPTDYITTGSTVTLSVNGSSVHTATVCLAGDCNGNGKLDVGDYIVSRRAYFGTIQFKNQACRQAADVNGNGEIDARDYLLIKRYFFTSNKALLENFI